MNRRHFLHLLSAGAFGAMTLDVDKLLWTPGERTIFLPAAENYSSLYRLTIDDITEAALALLRKQLEHSANLAGQRLQRQLGAYGGWRGGSAGIGIPSPDPGEALDTYLPRIQPGLANLATRLADTGTLAVQGITVSPDYFPAPNDTLLHVTAIRGQEDAYVRFRGDGVGRDRADCATHLRASATAQDGARARRHREGTARHR